jgi:hypothetical protein
LLFFYDQGIRNYCVRARNLPWIPATLKLRFFAQDVVINNFKVENRKDNEGKLRFLFRIRDMPPNVAARSQAFPPPIPGVLQRQL